jgi:primosomal protein N'
MKTHTVPTITITQRTLTCKHCRHTWSTVIPPPRLPKICPDCRSWYWQDDAAGISPKEVARIKAHVAARKQKKQG